MKVVVGSCQAIAFILFFIIIIISGKCISASLHPSEQLPNYCHKLQEATASMLTLGSIMVDIKPKAGEFNFFYLNLLTFT